MKAIGKNIVIRQVKESVRASSGIELSGDDVSKLRYSRGVVITPGTEVKSISAGDEIYYDKAQSFTMIVGEEQVIIIQERDVVLVI
jgi:co-chaperonin GroES (HSP10)